MLQMTKCIKHFLCFMKSLVQEKALSCLCFDSQSKGLMENQEPNKYGHVKESKSPCKQVRIQVLENVSSA